MNDSANNSIANSAAVNYPESDLHWPLRVYIEDTDAGGIVFYVNYLKYMERARTEFMRVHGQGKAAIFNSELMFVVRSMKINYRRSAKLDDQLIATARIVGHRAAQLTFEQRILRDAEILCDAHVNIACVDKQTLKVRRIPEQLLATLGVAST
jgi:4-hydroxybenzoyl-CoA thioesterase